MTLRMVPERASLGSLEGVRIIFFFGEEGGGEMYEFFDAPDILKVNSLLAQNTSPEWMLIASRDIMRVTIH